MSRGDRVYDQRIMRLRELSVLILVAGLGATLSQCAHAVTTDDTAPAPTETTGRDGGPSPKDAGCVTMCSGKCTDTLNDQNNCGKCSNACPTGATCNSGACVCGNNGKLCAGKCADTQTDVTNCGTCGTDCTKQGNQGTWSCVAGTCTLGCSGGQLACSNACFDPQTTDTHCGTCNNDCTTTNGSCCTGTCKDLTSDPQNCGSCGTSCGGGKCTNSACCTLEPTGTCDQNPCQSGFPLTPGCDGVGCVTKVCNNDPYCCLVDWDSGCVSEVDLYCAPQYKCKC